jgi:hypothetical protein
MCMAKGMKVVVSKRYGPQTSMSGSFLPPRRPFPSGYDVMIKLPLSQLPGLSDHIDLAETRPGVWDIIARKTKDRAMVVVRIANSDRKWVP